MPKDKTWDSSNDDPLTFKKRKLTKNCTGKDPKNCTENETKNGPNKATQGETQGGITLGEIFTNKVGENNIGAGKKDEIKTGDG